MNAPEFLALQTPVKEDPKRRNLLNFYEAIEQASQDMVQAAQAGDWDTVMRLEGACAVLISQLKNAATEQTLHPEEAQLKGRIMQRILHNDAAIRSLADPWIDEISHLAERGADDALH
jgi:flagellar protein FliT